MGAKGRRRGKQYVIKKHIYDTVAKKNESE
jgi:hypothetical protein